MKLIDAEGSLIINFIYSYNVYGGWLEGYPSIKDNPRGIENAKTTAKKLCYLEQYVYMENFPPILQLPCRSFVRQKTGACGTRPHGSGLIRHFLTKANY